MGPLCSRTTAQRRSLRGAGESRPRRPPDRARAARERDLRRRTARLPAAEQRVRRAVALPVRGRGPPAALRQGLLRLAGRAAVLLGPGRMLRHRRAASPAGRLRRTPLDGRVPAVVLPRARRRRAGRRRARPPRDARRRSRPAAGRHGGAPARRRPHRPRRPRDPHARPRAERRAEGEPVPAGARRSVPGRPVRGLAGRRSDGGRRGDGARRRRRRLRAHRRPRRAVRRQRRRARVPAERPRADDPPPVAKRPAVHVEAAHAAGSRAGRLHARA